MESCDGLLVWCEGRRSDEGLLLEYEGLNGELRWSVKGSVVVVGCANRALCLSDEGLILVGSAELSRASLLKD